MTAPDGAALRLVTWADRRPTGGNVYHDSLVGALSALGVEVPVIRLPGTWPDAAPPSRARLGRALRSGPRVLVDGIVAACSGPLVASATAAGVDVTVLVHLPAAEEVGISAAVAERYRTTEGRALHAATRVLATSRWSAERLAVTYRLPPVAVVTPGVAPVPLPPERPWGRSPRLLSLGALTPTKNQLTLVEALARVADLDWSAELAGPDTVDPAYAARVRTAVASRGLADRIRVPGIRTGPALRRSWAAADLLVLPSVVETYGLVVLEALARGVPALVPARTGAVEALAAGAGADLPRPGAVVDPGPEAWAEALRDWLSDPDQRNRWRAAALRARGGLPTWTDTARTLLDQLGLAGPAGAGPAGAGPA